MRALGIGLLVFNLLLTAAIGLYLAPQSWSKRQEMNATVAKHYLAKVGLPVESASKFDSASGTQPISFMTTMNHVVPSVSTELLTDYFNGSEAPPVISQMEEVDRAYNAKSVELQASPAEAILQLAGNFTPQGVFTPGLLTLMVKSYDERAEIRDLIPRGQAPASQFEEAAKKLKDKFAAQYNAVKSAATETEKKSRAAHFLAFLEPRSNTWQKRVILVVGLNQYQKTIGDQSIAYDEALRRVNRRIELDQDRFAQEYELLRKLAVEQGTLRNLTQEVEKLAAANQNDDQSAVNARTTQKTNRETELAAYQKRVADQLDANAAKEKQIQDMQRRVALMLDAIVAAEAKLAAAEQAAGGR